MANEIQGINILCSVSFTDLDSILRTLLNGNGNRKKQIKTKMFAWRKTKFHNCNTTQWSGVGSYKQKGSTVSTNGTDQHTTKSFREWGSSSFIATYSGRKWFAHITFLLSIYSNKNLSELGEEHVWKSKQH